MCGAALPLPVPPLFCGRPHPCVVTQTPLIFVLKCTGHKVSRGWQKALQTCGGGMATRPAVKRQQLAKVKLNRVVLKLEDNMYLIKTCDEIRKRIQLRQFEPVHKGSGHIDARWECTITAFVETNGLTVVIARLRKLYLLATPEKQAGPTLKSFKAAVEADKWQQMSWWETLFYDEVTITVTVTKGRKKNREQTTRIEYRERDLSATLTLDEMYDAYKGPHVLPQQEVLSIELDDKKLTKEQLWAAVNKADTTWKAARENAQSQTSKMKGLAGIQPPAAFGPAASHLAPIKVPGLLWDQRDVDLAMRDSVFEAFGALHVRPFLHFLELRQPGIFFLAFERISRHRAVNTLFIKAASATDCDERFSDCSSESDGCMLTAVREADVRLGRALSFALAHAEELKSRGYGMAGRQPCLDIILEIGTSYGQYCNDQFAEWNTNPVYRLGCVGSSVGGPAHAKWLTRVKDENGLVGKPKLRAALAKVLHILPRDVQVALDDAAYTDPDTGGPMRLASEKTEECRTLWRELEEYSNESEALAVIATRKVRPLYQRLFAHIEHFYRPLLLVNAMGEEGVKGGKHVKPQQALFPIGTEVRLQNHFHTIWEAGMWGQPPREWLARQRAARKEAARKAAEERKQQREAPPAKPLRNVELHGATDSPETSGDEAFVDPLAESDGEGGDPSQESAVVDNDGSAHRPIAKEELVEGLVCWCYDIDKPRSKVLTSKKVSFPVVLLADYQRGTEYISCMCLTDGAAAGEFVPDNRVSSDGKTSYLDTRDLVSLLFFDESRPLSQIDGEQRWYDPGVWEGTIAQRASGNASGDTVQTPIDAKVKREPELSKRDERSLAREAIKTSSSALSTADKQREALVPPVASAKSSSPMVPGKASSSESSGKAREGQAPGRTAARQMQGTADGSANDLWDVWHQSHVWQANSCYVDAPIELWFFLQLWLGSKTSDQLILPVPLAVERNAFRAAAVCVSTAKDNIDLTEDSEPATSTISIRSDATAALKDWWAARVELYHATSPPTEERISDG